VNVKDVLCLCVDAVTVVLYNTMKALSELTEIPVTQVQHFQNINFISLVCYIHLFLLNWPCLG